MVQRDANSAPVGFDSWRKRTSRNVPEVRLKGTGVVANGLTSRMNRVKPPFSISASMWGAWGT